MSANAPTAVDPTEPIDRQTFGEAAVRIVVDEATDERLREAYQLAKEEHGSAVGSYDMFVLNHTEPEYVVEVEPTETTDEIAASAEYDSEGDTPVSVELELPPGADPEADLDSVDIQIRDEHSEADPENNTTPEANHD